MSRLPVSASLEPDHDAAKVRFWRDARLPWLETSLVVHSVHTFPRHAHEFLAIGLMEQGANYCLDSRSDETLVASGQIALLNAGQMHTGNPPPQVRSTYRMLFVDPAWLTELARETLDREPGDAEFARVVVTSPLEWQRLRELSRQLAGGGPPLVTESLLVAALVRLMASHGGHRVRLPLETPGAAAALERDARVRRVQDYLRAHADAQVSLPRLAELAGLSRFHLLRLFSRATGLSPHAYHLQLRVERAKTLLRQGLPIAEVAGRTGFGDQSHLTNVFKRYVGATPGCYRGS